MTRDELIALAKEAGCVVSNDALELADKRIAELEKYGRVQDPLADRIAELEAQLAEVNADATRWQNRWIEADKQLAELAKQEPVANVFSCRYIAELRIYSSQVHSYLPLASGDSLYAAPVVPDGMVKDAERYRWIRKCMPFSTLKNVSKRYAENVPNDEVDARLDAAIDAAIAAAQEEA